MSHFPEGKKSEKSLSTLGFYIFLSGELIFFILCIYHKEIMSFVFIEKKLWGSVEFTYHMTCKSCYTIHEKQDAPYIFLTK